MVEQEIEIHQRPSGPIRDEIVSIANALTSQWFTANVPGDTYQDLGFQDIMVLRQSERIVSFIMFTCLDGDIHISLMGTRPELIGKGYGSQLMNEFISYVKSLGFKRIVVYTVPPDKKPSYHATMAFYEKHGFTFTKRYDELWEAGAIQLTRILEL
jgi:ribosomal protein S18 acetylase RimI-like enzyme